MTQPIDLSPDHAKIVHEIIARLVPGDVSVRVFGSRATWTAKTFSDLDLALRGKEPQSLAFMAELAEAFDESDLPFRVDVVDWHSVSPSFQAVIDRDGVRLGWPTISLGDLCDLGLAQIQTGPFGSQLHSHDYLPEGVPVVPTEAIKNRRIDISVCPRISQQKASELSRHFLQAGDILFARRGVQATGHIGVVRAAENGYVCGTGAIRLRIVATNKLIQAEYLSHLLADPASIAWFKFHAIGATMPNLNDSIIKSFTLRLPPIPEQRSIASVLSALDDKIESNRRMNETLEAMAQAIFKDWFVDFGPTRRKLAGITDPVAVMGGLTPDAARATELAALFPDALGDEGLPVGWVASTLGKHMVNFDSKRVPVSGAVRSKRKGVFPYHGATGIMDYVDDYLFDGIYLLVGEDGSVVKESGLAFTQYVWGKIWVNNHAHVLQGKDGVSTEQLFLYFSHEPVEPFITGAVQLKLSQGRMNSMPFLDAGESINSAFFDLVSPLFARLRAASEENRTLAETRDYLLPKLMSGEVRVRDAEMLAEGTPA